MARGFFYTNSNNMDGVKQKRRWADAGLQDAMKSTPVANTGHGLLKVLEGGLAGYIGGKTDANADELFAKQEAELAQRNDEARQRQLGAGGGAPAPMAAANASQGLSPAASGNGQSFKFDDDTETAIANASKAHGVPLDYMRIKAQIESKGNPDAENPNSSAGGLYQFIDSTAGEYGLQGDDRYDAHKASDAAARFAKNNFAGLRKSLGREPEGWEGYLAHQQGLGGANKILGNPNALAVDTLGRDAVRLNGGQDGWTNAQMAENWKKKYMQYSGGLPQAAPLPSTGNQLASRFYGGGQQ
jgi:hypothetical protein